MKRLLVVLAAIVINLTLAFGKEPARVLVFSKTTGFRHTSIKTGIETITNLGKANGFEVFATEDASQFNFKNLKRYRAIIFLNTTGNELFSEKQKHDFQKYIRKGGGFVGIHAATDCLYNWDWYGSLTGARFASHPKIQAATLKVLNKQHQSTESLPESLIITDEWYNFKDIKSTIQVLITLDEGSYQVGINGNHHPITWFQQFEGGRVFYTGLGHRDETYANPDFLKLLLGGIRYAGDF